MKDLKDEGAVKADLNLFDQFNRMSKTQSAVLPNMTLGANNGERTQSPLIAKETIGAY